MTETMRWFYRIAEAKTVEEVVYCLQKAYPDMPDEEAEERAKKYLMI
ncbi:hypothetical protein [Anaerovibrio sp. RM50]|nr:hypothetical protein [Anaerovibrio sp. RM50]